MYSQNLQQSKIYGYIFKYICVLEFFLLVCLIFYKRGIKRGFISLIIMSLYAYYVSILGLSFNELVLFIFVTILISTSIFWAKFLPPTTGFLGKFIEQLRLNYSIVLFILFAFDHLFVLIHRLTCRICIREASLGGLVLLVVMILFFILLVIKRVNRDDRPQNLQDDEERFGLNDFL